jgi:hypothetical protein
VLRGVFGPKRGEVTGDWRKLHNEELHNSYSSQKFDISLFVVYLTTVSLPHIVQHKKLRREGDGNCKLTKPHAIHMFCGGEV